MNEDWLDLPGEEVHLPDRWRESPVEGKPAEAIAAQLPISSGAVVVATATIERRAQFQLAWQGLSESQRVFLNTWRECRFNANKAVRILAGTAHGVSKTTVWNWQSDEMYESVRTVLRTASVDEILSRDYLAARQEDIVETLLTPKPILHQGLATGHFEVEAAAASRANETLLKLGGHLKEKDQQINIGIVGPSFVIQVVQPDGEVLDVTPAQVSISLPEPIDAEFTEKEDDEWLSLH